MEPIGHVGMALLFASPVWFARDAMESFSFSVAAAAAGLAPDSDIYLKTVIDVAHHGITHTVAFAAGLAAAFGLVGAAVAAALDGDPRDAGTLAAAAGLVGAGAHLFADLLTTPDVAPPLKPFLPLSDARVVLDVVYVYSDVWNLLPLALALLAHVAFAAATTDGARLRSVRSRLRAVRSRLGRGDRR